MPSLLNSPRNHRAAAALLLLMCFAGTSFGVAEARRQCMSGGCQNPSCSSDPCAYAAPPLNQCIPGWCCSTTTSHWATYCFSCPGWGATGWRVDFYDDGVEPGSKPCTIYCTDGDVYICWTGWG